MRVATSDSSRLADSQYSRERELLRDNPELLTIVNDKIDEWIRIKGKLFCKDVLPSLKHIQLLEDSFARWYWKEALKCMLPKRYVGAVINLERLRQLKRDVTKPNRSGSFEDFARRKEQAKHISISSLYPFQKMTKKGGRAYACCPFHDEKSASFVIYPDNSFHCFGCRVHGRDSIDFIRLINKCDFKSAVAQLVGA